MNALRTLTCATLLLAASLPALADALANATELKLTTATQRAVANDQVDVVLYVQVRDSKPASLANALNRTVAQAMSTARAYPQVIATSGSTSSWPDHDKNGAINAWQGRASMHLKSGNFIQTAQLVAQLQKTMLVQSVDFSVAGKTRKLIEQQMLPDAIQQLKTTAEVAGKALGKSHVTVRELNIGNNGNPVPRPMMMMARMGNTPSQDVTAPDWQAGQTVLQLQISGKLLLN